MSFEGSEIGRLLSEAVAAGTVHGVVAMVVDRDGVLYESAAGAAGPETMFRNASMTKAVATTGALQLVEQGRLELDQTVESVLPEFGELQVIEGFDGERPILRPPATKPTFRQLMTHTAGLGYFFLNERLFRYVPATGLPSPLEGKKIALNAPLVNDPADRLGVRRQHRLAGARVERITGRTLGEYVAEHVYGPLGMIDSTFHPTDEQRARLLPVRCAAPTARCSRPSSTCPPSRSGTRRSRLLRDRTRLRALHPRVAERRRTRRTPGAASATVPPAFEDHIEGIPLPELMTLVHARVVKRRPGAARAAGLGARFSPGQGGHPWDAQRRHR